MVGFFLLAFYLYFYFLTPSQDTVLTLGRRAKEEGTREPLLSSP